VAPRALHPANAVEPEAPRLEDPELALVAAVRALDQAVPLSLPVSLALKRFSAGPEGPLRSLPSWGVLRRPWAGLYLSWSGRARQRTRTCNRFSGPKNRFKACRRDPIAPLWR